MGSDDDGEPEASASLVVLLQVPLSQRLPLDMLRGWGSEEARMSIYVDELRSTVHNRRWRYDQGCHLMADTLEELDAFALRLGLKRCWRDSDHYDLTAQKRYQAVRMGAEEVTRRDIVRIRRGEKGQRSLFEGGEGR